MSFKAIGRQFGYHYGFINRNIKQTNDSVSPQREDTASFSTTTTLSTGRTKPISGACHGWSSKGLGT